MAEAPSYIKAVKEEAQTFTTHENFTAEEEAEYSYYRSLSGNKKLQLMLEIMAPVWEAHPRFERVYRVVEFPKS